MTFCLSRTKGTGRWRVIMFPQELLQHPIKSSHLLRGLLVNDSIKPWKKCRLQFYGGLKGAGQHEVKGWTGGGQEELRSWLTTWDSSWLSTRQLIETRLFNTDSHDLLFLFYLHTNSSPTDVRSFLAALQKETKQHKSADWTATEEPNHNMSGGGKPISTSEINNQ